MPMLDALASTPVVRAPRRASDSESRPPPQPISATSSPLKNCTLPRFSSGVRACVVVVVVVDVVEDGVDLRDST